MDYISSDGPAALDDTIDPTSPEGHAEAARVRAYMVVLVEKVLLS